jgi:CubicO group peptidase (beta-lactamase class C family)
MNILLCGLLLPFGTAPVLADFLGPSWSAPSDLSSNQSLVAAGFRNITATLQGYLDGDTQAADPAILGEMSNLTFSIGMFSLHDPAATELQFHYTSPEIANAPNGTHKVDADSIYRVASVTKLFTVLGGMLELDSSDWDRSLADIFPELGDFASKNPGEDDPIYTVQWDKVTLSALAAQIAGVPRDGFPALGEILVRFAFGGPDPSSMGFPPPSPSDPLENPPCASILDSTCPPVPYLQTTSNRPPSFLPWTTPAYANNGFALLGLAIANITGRSIDQIFSESIFEPLGMDSSNTTTPPLSVWDRSVIPGDPAVNFAFDAGIFVSSGAVSSTTRDLAKFGLAILNSTLLPAEETRRWMKPVSHTARLQYSVGRPWEIHRFTHASGVVTDIYTKSGDSGAYSAFEVLLPDYDAGFSILSSSTMPDRFDVLAAITDVVTNTIVPALAAEAAAEAARKFAGVYKSTESGLDSSLTLVVNQTVTDAPGLVISSWISNGTDVLSTMSPNPGLFPWRLVPSISDAAHDKMAFRLVSGNDAPGAQEPVGSRLFLGRGFAAADWVGVDSITYGGIGTTLFVFDIDCDGKATAVSPAAFRVTLEKSA